jgi:oligopeptide/dipeptide ABC transporter ATP-binding protein
MTLVTLEAVSKEFSIGSGAVVRAVDDVDLVVNRGEALGIVGESGSGKSTLARLIVRLITPTTGTVYFDGEDIGTLKGRNVRRFRSAVQMVFQEPYGSLNPRMRVRTILDRPMLVNGLGSRRDRRRRAIELLDAVGLAPGSLARYPHEFSGGQQQRIAIARALAVRPEVIVLDEPTSALDTSVQAQLLNLLSDLKSETGVTYILISHNLAVVNHMADRVAVMYLGHIVEVASRHEIFAKPLHPYTKALIEAIPQITGREGLVETGIAVGAEVSVAAGGCRFRNRCPIAVGRCSIEEPLLQAQNADAKHLVRCHLV